MLAYVDDVLHLAKDAQEGLFKLNQVYRLKVVFGPQYRYLGANDDKVQLEYVKTVWSITCVEYMHKYINNIHSILEGNKQA